MQVYVIHPGGSLAELRQRVRALEQLGVAGMLLSDHLFGTGDRQLPEPLTTLATIATLSEHLEVGTIVSNTAFAHPALLLRQFANLAALFGGQRVLAGLGAGWNGEEFDAIGQPMPSYADRLQRLEETAQLARQLFDHGRATLQGTQVVTHNLPLVPMPAVPPRLLLGGGSDRLLQIAGRYADLLDLNGSSRRPGVAGPDLRQADLRRRLTTSLDDLAGSVERVRRSSLAAGRPRQAVRLSIIIGSVVFCPAAEVRAHAERIGAPAGVPAEVVVRCPYVLLGEPAAMAQRLAETAQRLELDAVILSGGVDVARFCQQVLARR